MPIPMKRKVQKRQSAKMNVYYTLRDWITYGTLAPGERLNTQELSEYFDVSRIPIREAIQMLESQKLVVVHPNKGTSVSEIDVGDFEKWYLPLAHLHALAAKIACDVITEEQYEKLKAIDKKIETYIQKEDTNDTLLADEEFHMTLLKIANNEFIIEFSEMLMLHIRRIERYMFNHDRRLMSFSSYAELMDAIHRRDRKSAFEAMLANWMNTFEKDNNSLLETVQDNLNQGGISKPAEHQLFILSDTCKES